MLQIKNITKTYRPKKGVPVKALDDISLSFSNKGLVFVLGKSGSGKSTLLNVIGGLDKADSGEFIIKGKSSKDFSQSDFDAYRNTFIGFIFQEYNILNEFNVGQNIALAMELQGKKASKESLKQILEEVDLPGYETRKPNELSGGQKQRIAIARALIKEPEIIMADEPTGALDSNTGKQVFDTLKKLSKNKLVIVVSHDREFAEYYGDRVIELADGKIISDISKYETQPEIKSNRLSIIDDKIIHIKKGSEITEKDFEIIREYIRKNQGDILISSDERSNSSFKQIAMISDDGNKTSFKDTTEENTPKTEYTTNDSKFIKSRLPYRNALKIGANSIKTKPIRLFFTILLSFISFAMFGLADSFASYDKTETAARSIINSNINYASFSVNNIYLEKGNDYLHTTPAMGDNNSKNLLEDNTGLTVFPVYRGIDNLNNAVMLPSLAVTNTNYYYLYFIAGVTEIGQNEIAEMNYLVTGRMPSADNEIAITKYQYETYNYYGFTPTRSDEKAIPAGQVVLTGSENSIIGKHVQLSILGNSYHESLSDIEFEIVGVVDTKLDSKYNNLKTTTDSGSGFTDYVIYNEFANIISNGIHGMMFVNQGLLDKVIEKNISTRNGTSYETYLAIRDFGTASQHMELVIKTIEPLPSNLNEIVWVNGEKNTLSDNEVILPFYMFREIENILLSRNIPFPSTTFYTSQYNDSLGDFETINTETLLESNIGNYNSSYLRHLYIDALVRYVKTHSVPESFIKERRQNGINYIDENQWKIEYIHELNSWEGFNYNYMDVHQLGAKITTEAFATFINQNNYFDFADLIKMKDLHLRYENEWVGDLINIAGFKINANIMDYNDSTMIVSDDFYNNALTKNQNFYVGFIGVMPKNNSQIMELVKYSYDSENKVGLQFSLQNQVMTSLTNINDIIETTSKIFLYIGLGLAVFSALLLANFIAVSIANKKREIGILRAVGAKSLDVFTIFFNESIIIALINFALALIGAVITCILFNNLFMKELGVSITILSFGIRQIALMFIVSIGVALIASFIPVMSIARKQPIDSIQDR